jgi:hypothetical protein
LLSVASCFQIQLAPLLIGDEAADALKSLQQNNKPFPDKIAYRTIAEAGPYTNLVPFSVQSMLYP